MLRITNIYFPGITVKTIDTLGEFANFRSKYIGPMKGWNDMSQMVFDKKADIGVPTPINYDRFHSGDFTSITSLSKFQYVVPGPKPVDSLYKLITPFQVQVWYAYKL